MILLLSFLCAVNIQYLHHHNGSGSHTEAHGKTTIGKSAHCKTCDHFLHHKTFALCAEATSLDLSVSTYQADASGFYIIGHSLTLILCFSNKGPPAIA
ncbi:hypothetical protein ACJVDH_06110 [Pedobacter sp. AW1-32]|uniref:hypothetical protein n=1 Tax=Pedobacter sp. AW1-32 TaxID=3383026 RepID=UPI003FEF735B